MKDLKSVTVCITTYNRPKTATLAILAVANQSPLPAEVIVVDDGSSVEYSQDFYSLQDSLPYLRYVKHETNRGLGAARNTGLSLCHTEYILFLDDDDLVNDGFAKCLSSMLHLFVESDVFIFYTRRRRIIFRHTMIEHIRLSRLFQNGFSPPVSSQIYRTSLLKAVNGYDERVLSGVDTGIWVRLLSFNPLVTVYWNSFVSVGVDCPERLTTQLEIRMTRVKQSLDIWRAYIEDAYSKEFFLLFAEEYIAHIRAGFVSQYLKAFSVRILASKEFRLSDYLRVLKNFFFHRLLGKNGNPTFFLKGEKN